MVSRAHYGFVIILASCASLSWNFAEAGYRAILAVDARQSVCRPEQFRIGIDVGHTPEAPGATSARGVSEYQFNLNLARTIQATLEKGGFDQISLIRANGIGRNQLLERADEANSARVNLLLSIHHDGVQPRYLQKWIFQGKQQYYSDLFSGYSLFVSRENPSATQSAEFAQLLADALMKRGLHYSPHHAEHIPGENRTLLDKARGIYRFDGLVVLRYTRAPAVLLEAGVILNRDEEIILSSPDRQRLVSDAILEAVTEFCSKPTAASFFSRE
jgi:N-acetylmuramoyl-L-alanine amidase